MAAAEDEGQMASRQAVADSIRQRLLRLFQILSLAEQITGILDWLICGPGQVGQRAAQTVGAVASTDAPLVAPNAFITAETQQSQSIALPG